MSGKVITIVGSGASSVSLIDALLENLCLKNNIAPDLTIFLIDKRPQFGRGLAYADDTSTSLLNTRASFISPFSDKPGHFYNWLLQNKSIWEDDFPDVVLSPEAFLPRSLFGNYLTHMVQSLSKKAVEIGCRVITINDEAYRITFAHDGKVVVSTRANLSFPSDHVVLSCGNGESIEYKIFENTPGFFSSPYPIKRTTRVIPKDARVAIIGSRLSAIDMAIGLKSGGHTGPITFHSRTGSLPGVRGIQGRYKPKYLTPQLVQEHIHNHGKLSLNELLDWTMKELAAAGQTGVPTIEELTKTCRQPAPLQYLEHEINSARIARPWQAVLYATNSIMDLIWPAMPMEDKLRFWPYMSWWLSHRVSIPIENAQKIYSLLKSGELNIVAGDLTLEALPNSGFCIRVTDNGNIQEHEYDTLVVATGTPRDPSLLDNELVQNMLAQGTAIADPFGGVQVSADRGSLRGSSGRFDDRITVLGELTSGTYFFTSALEINARHAANRATIIIERLGGAGKLLIEAPSHHTQGMLTKNFGLDAFAT
ncbi:hypothetical protein BJP27_05825 [Pseudomonas oryzihabitans]|nr:hypothetical protein BJP27_05825 [Pseudomonas psychrotolerans]